MSDAVQTRRQLAISAYNNASDILDRSELSEEDANTLVRHYDDDDDGSISIGEFCDALTAAPMAFRA